MLLMCQNNMKKKNNVGIEVKCQFLTVLLVHGSTKGLKCGIFAASRAVLSLYFGFCLTITLTFIYFQST